MAVDVVIVIVVVVIIVEGLGAFHAGKQHGGMCFRAGLCDEMHVPDVHDTGVDVVDTAGDDLTHVMDERHGVARGICELRQEKKIV